MIFADADAKEVARYTAMFDAAGHAATGAVFWPDRHTSINDARP